MPARTKRKGNADTDGDNYPGPITKADLIAKVRARLSKGKRAKAAERLTEDTMGRHEAVKDVIRALPPGKQRDDEEAILRQNLEDDLRALSLLRPLQAVEKAWWKRVVKKPLP